LKKYGFDNSQPFFIIGLLVVATVFTAAGGYALNDYFDVKIDAINKPEKQIVGKYISRNNAAITHQIFTALGMIAGLLMSYYLRSITLGMIFIAVPGLLWFYSASYKRQLITGNLVVSLLSGLTVLVVGITAVNYLKKPYGMLIMETPIPGEIYTWTGGFSLFSFLFTWIREIVKDMEDEKGDREAECRTMPVVWGMKNSKLVVYLIITVTNAALYLTALLFIPFDGNFTFRYIITGITLPSVALIYLIYTAKTPADFHTASTLIKVIMLIGVLYALVFYYYMAKIFDLSFFNLFIVK
jgi:4-hydroxybenzoate polyprenyltransferase